MDISSKAWHAKPKSKFTKCQNKPVTIICGACFQNSFSDMLKHVCLTSKHVSVWGVCVALPEHLFDRRSIWPAALRQSQSFAGQNCLLSLASPLQGNAWRWGHCSCSAGEKRGRISTESNEQNKGVTWHMNFLIYW